jgi:putative flavoprotein involved in K+ transport
MERTDVAVVGAGQAGLAVSHELSAAGVDHVVLERGRVGETWRGRWDSFCLVTPNWATQLPGMPYAGDDPDGYAPRDEIVSSLERYAAAFDAPVREQVEVSSVRTLGTDGEGFVLLTSDGELRAGSLVLSTGAYQRPYRPAGADGLPDHLPRLDVSGYRSPDALPDRAVLVIGSGQSGCQISEELADAGREVFLSCGRAPWVPRRIGGRDLVWWSVKTGYMDAGVASLATPEARLAANLQATGHGGGHDLHYRTLRARGVTLVGRFQGVSGGRARFASDLAVSVAWGDERHRQFTDLIRRFCADRGAPPPEMPEPEPFDPTAPEEVDLAGIGAVVFTGGFRPDYSWTGWREAFDAQGFPLHREGASTVVPNLYFCGVHFLRKRKSSLLLGVGEDAAIVARTIAGRPKPWSYAPDPTEVS